MAPKVSLKARADTQKRKEYEDEGRRQNYSCEARNATRH